MIAAEGVDVKLGVDVAIAEIGANMGQGPVVIKIALIDIFSAQKS